MKWLSLVLGLCLSLVASAQEVRTAAFDGLLNEIDWNDPQQTIPGANLAMGTKGELIYGAVGTFQSLYPYGFREGLVTKSSMAWVSDFVFDGLMAQIQPPLKRSYLIPAIARAVRWSKDKSYVIFELNPEARFSDGSSVTAEDVSLSFSEYKSAWGGYVKNLKSGIASIVPGPGEVRVNLNTRGFSSVAVITQFATIPILRRTHRLEFADGLSQEYLGTGPYVVKEANNHEILIEKRSNTWSQNLSHRRGLFHFQQIRVRGGFGGDSVLQQALLKGEISVLRFDSAQDASKFEYQAQGNERVALRKVARDVNQFEQEKIYFRFTDPFLSDVRVREALALALNFDEINFLYFGGALARASSLFPNTDYEAKGVPSAVVVERLHQCTGVNPKAFEAIENVGANRHLLFKTERERLREALRLLVEAGYHVRGTELVGPERPVIHVVYNGSKAERVLGLYKHALNRLGIEVEALTVPDGGFLINLVKNNRYSAIPDALNVLQDGDPDPDILGKHLHSSLPTEEPLVTNLNRLSDPCVDGLIDEMARLDPRSQKFHIAAESLDRIYQTLFVGANLGGERYTYRAIDSRIQLPDGQSWGDAPMFGSF